MDSMVARRVSQEYNESMAHPWMAWLPDPPVKYPRNTVNPWPIHRSSVDGMVRIDVTKNCMGIQSSQVFDWEGWPGEGLTWCLNRCLGQ